MAVEVNMYLRILRNIIFVITVIFHFVNRSIQEDYLLPYQIQHGSKLNHRQIRECQPAQYSNSTQEIFSATSQKISSLPFVETKTFIMQLDDKRYVKGHYSIVRNPLASFSVLEPLREGGCSNHIRANVQTSAQQKKCIVAMNAGYFNTTNGKCIGNIVSDGRFVQASHVQNANFGILKNGSILTGYLSEEEMVSNNSAFYQLVSGVIWLLRNGEIYIKPSMDAECSDSEETGSFKTFVEVQSARTAIGHDNKGQIILLHVEGKTNVYGVNLWELAGIMRRFGAINAINTDGGGSATYVLNDVVVNYPSDNCIDDSDLKCARNVSTIFCVHEPICKSGCDPLSVCEEHWMDINCSSLSCDIHNCTNHGNCTEQGCVCKWGWIGDKCDIKCSSGFWGPNCTMPCLCKSNSTCNHETGDCNCLPGFTGVLCDHKCPFGWYGLNCKNECICPSSCPCNHISGICDNSFKEILEPKIEECIVQNAIHNLTLVPFQPNQYRLWIMLVIIMSCLAFAGIVSTLLLLKYAFQKRRQSFDSSVVKYNRHRNFSSSSDEETHLYSDN